MSDVHIIHIYQSYTKNLSTINADIKSDIFQGDSGTPLIQKVGDAFYQVGLASNEHILPTWTPNGIYSRNYPGMGIYLFLSYLWVEVE